MTVYTTTMAEALAKMRGLQEDNMDLMRKAVTGSMQTLKMKDGKLKMDKVTASAIMQILDKVNPANQKKMEQIINDGNKSGIMKLADFAMSKVTGFKREEIDLDERKKEKGPRQLIDPDNEVMVVKKNAVIVIDKKDEDKYLKQGWSLAEESDLDEAASSQVLAHGGKGQYKVVSGPAKDGSRETVVKFKGKVVSRGDYDSGADGWYMNIKGKKGQEFFDDAQKMADYFAKNKITEEVDLDEKTKWKMGDGRPRGGAYIENERFWDLDIDALKYIMKDADTAMKANPTGRKAGKYADEVNDAHTVIGWRKKNGIKEEVEVDPRKLPDMRDALMQVRTEKPAQLDEQLSRIKGNTPADQGRRAAVEDDIERAEKKGDKKEVKKLKEDDLDEGRMKELHGYIQDGKSAEWIAKKMGVDVKTIKSLMSEAYELGTNEYREYIEKLTPGEVDEASARADAKKAMRQDKKVDSADVDDDASDEDIKGASKNIIMQMRKAVSLRGTFPVEFGDKKKVKIPVKVAQAVQDKFSSIKKPADKEKFQAQAAKSYKDMLNVLKAGYNEEVDLDEDFSVEVPKQKINGKTYGGGLSIIVKAKTVSQAIKMVARRLKVNVNFLKIGKVVKEEIDLDGGGTVIVPRSKVAVVREEVKKETILDRIDRKLKERKNG